MYHKNMLLFLKVDLSPAGEDCQHAVTDESLCPVTGCALGTDVCHWMFKNKSQHGSRSRRWAFNCIFFINCPDILVHVMFMFMFLMTSGLSKGHSVSCVDHTFPNLQITRSDIRPHIKWAVSLVIAYGHFNLPRGFVWVCMRTYSLYHPRG